MTDNGTDAAISFAGLVFLVISVAMVTGFAPDPDIDTGGFIELRVDSIESSEGIIRTATAGPPVCDSRHSHYGGDPGVGRFSETQFTTHENATTGLGIREIHFIHGGQLVWESGLEIGETRFGGCIPPGESRAIALDADENTIGEATITIREKS